MLTIREIEYVLTVARQKSISRAAQICNVSQPSLTIALDKLEDNLGFEIFERARNNNIATPKGRELILHFEDIFAQYKKVKQIGKDSLELKIGIIPTVAPYLLPRIVKKLHLQKTQIQFFEQKTETALKNLQDGQLDLVILAFYPKIIPKYLMYEKLYEEEFFFVTHKSVNISINQGLESNKMILLEEGNCINESIEGICDIYNSRQNQNKNASSKNASSKNASSKNASSKNASSKNASSKNDFSATSIEVTKAMICIDNGYGILPKLSLESFEDVRKNFKIKPFYPPKYRQIGICYRKNFADKEVVEDLVKIFKV
jgi:LysR family hydrogen peroxide-inducible transcriptional activator